MTPEQRAEFVIAAWMGKKLSMNQQSSDIADAIRAAILAERERCAKLVESHDGESVYTSDASGEEYLETVYDMIALAERIRETPKP